jgi:predicted RNA-binding Zn ribbon-like protein
MIHCERSHRRLHAFCHEALRLGIDHSCESCVVHFFDTSKKGSRRWCSMNICGNKLKVAAYQRRKRTTETAMK